MRSEYERIQRLHTSASEAAVDLDTQKRHLREDVRELKNREQRLLNDYSELEEENINLQKQVCRINFSCQNVLQLTKSCMFACFIKFFVR